MFQSSEIYGGLNGFWDYGPLGVELKRNIKEAWWRDMVTGHDDSTVQPGAPEAYEMTGLDCTIIMHPQVWKCSGHYDLFHDYMVDCRESKGRYRHDQVRDAGSNATGERIFVATTAEADHEQEDVQTRALKYFKLRSKEADQLHWDGDFLALPAVQDVSRVLGPDASSLGTLTEPREFNLMFETHTGASTTSPARRSCVRRRSSSARGLPVRKRPDLQSRRHHYLGKSYWIVKDPVGLNYFRFQEEEYFILQMLDGQTSLDEIKETFESEFPPQKITLEELQNFLGMLHRSGMVISAVPDQGRELLRRFGERRRQEWLAAFVNILCLRFKGVDPEWLLNWLLPRFGWLFTRLAE